MRNCFSPARTPPRRLPTMINSTSQMSASRVSAYATSPASSRKDRSMESSATACAHLGDESFVEVSVLQFGQLRIKRQRDHRAVR